MVSHLLLHQIFELCDLLRVFRVAGDVLFIKERLEMKEDDTSCTVIINTIAVCQVRLCHRALPVSPLGIWRCLR